MKTVRCDLLLWTSLLLALYSCSFPPSKLLSPRFYSLISSAKLLVSFALKFTDQFYLSLVSHKIVLNWGNVYWGRSFYFTISWTQVNIHPPSWMQTWMQGLPFWKHVLVYILPSTYTQISWAGKTFCYKMLENLYLDFFISSIGNSSMAVSVITIQFFKLTS